MIKIKYKQIFIFIFCFFSCLMFFGYLGLFTKYRLIPSYCYFLYLILTIFFRKVKFKFDKFNAVITLLTVYIFLSAIVNNRQTGLDYLIFMINGILLSLVMIDSRNYKKILNVFLLISLIFALFTIWNHFDSNIIIRLFGPIIHSGQINTILINIENGGVPGLAGEASYNAFVLSIGIIIILAKVISSNILTWKSFLAFMIIFSSLVLTGKRSLLLIICVLSAISIMYYVEKKYRLNRIYYMIIVCFLLLIISPFVMESIFEVLSKGGDSVDLSNRDWFWRMAVEMFEKSPIFGNGINTYDFVYNANKTGLIYVAYAGAHNSYIQYLAELGIIGFSLLVTLIVYNLKFTLMILKNVNHLVLKEKESINFALLFSMLGQVLIVFYAFSENPFYQPQQITLYFFMCFISFNIYRCFGKGKIS